MSIVDSGGLSIELPKLIKIRQKFPKSKLLNIENEICDQFNRRNVSNKIKPGMSIGIGVGSRGITKIDSIVKTVVHKIKEYGAKPVIITAMGSQGGASAKGQIEILKELGITESLMGAPIKSTMEVIKITDNSYGGPIYFNKMAYSLDGIIPINRVKWHTDFVGEIESGLIKMLVIGFANQKGANSLHSLGYGCFSQIIPEVGKLIIEKTKIIFGVACIEDAYKNILEINIIYPNDFFEEEKRMLKIVKKNRAKINFSNIDVLIIDEIGKDISGTGIDPKIVGRFHQREKVRKNDMPGPKIRQIAMLDLSKGTLGNACGIGYADVISKKLFDKIDFLSTYTNVCVGHVGCIGDNFYEIKIPIIMENDQKAIHLALKLAKKSEHPVKSVKVARIKNTSSLEIIDVSESLFYEVVEKGNIEIIGRLEKINFDKDGMICK